METSKMFQKKAEIFTKSNFLHPQNVIFTAYTSDELRKLSVVRVQTPLGLNPLGHPIPGGLYDAAMGPMNEQSEPCQTCLKNVFGCPGHMGHVELPVPVVNPLFHKIVAVFMKTACLHCHRLQIAPLLKWQIIAQIQLGIAGCVAEAIEVDINTTSALDLSNTPTNVQESIVKARITDYIQEVLKEKGLSDVRNISKSSESFCNYLLNNFLKGGTCFGSCIFCKGPINKVTLFKDRLTQSVKLDAAPDDTSETMNTSSNGTPKSKKPASKFQTQMMNPIEIREHLRQLWENEKDFLGSVVPVLRQCASENPTDLFFMDVIPVPPPNIRPLSVANGKISEHPQTTVYKKLVADSLIMWNVIQSMKKENLESVTNEGLFLMKTMRGSTSLEKMHFAWQELQLSVDHLFDAESGGVTSKIPVQGIKQLLEKKEGLIRMHIMGKRVNYAARSVITPDPNLNIDEIGFPEAFALKLTYPVPVTPWNVKELRKMVRNGPLVHPGAVMVEDENGSICKLSPHDQLQRDAVAKRLLTPSEQEKHFTKNVKKVYRHLVNGDFLILNRQPTLHRPSMMAHRARILKGEKTLRLHYSNCRAYNSDFDGDEMNAHAPQSELARSESVNLVSVCQQYLVPKDGTPLGGLIQDHIVSGVHLSIRGKFFTLEDYTQLVYQAISDTPGKIKLLPPAIIKPVKLWSGKQIISTVIINTIPRGKHLINLHGKAKIKDGAWQRNPPRRWKKGGSQNLSLLSEGEVIIRQGELLCGVLDKNHYGATPYGLVHCMYELYGGVCSSRLLSAFSKLFMAFLQYMQGFTLGVEDILVVTDADKRRADLIEECRKIGKSVAAAALNLPANSPTDLIMKRVEEAYSNPKMNFRGEMDRHYKTALNHYTDNINKTCLPAGLLQQFPANNLQLMVQSGAKGSTVNTMQMSCLLGQIELEGKRPPLMVSGRSLPSFAPYDLQPRAGGFIDGRFMTGIQPQEFFFHCMAGREGLIDTAVKTSRSGYLQRCLIKNLEGLSIQYDMTVRDSDGSVIQFAYGEDGMDVSKCQFLKPEQLSFLEGNLDAFYDQQILTMLKNDEMRETIHKQKKTIKKWKKSGFEDDKRRKSTFLNFSSAMLPSLNTTKISKKNGRRKGLAQLIELYRETPKNDPEMMNFHVNQKCPDPVAASFPTGTHFGVLTELLENIIEDYVNGKKQSHSDKHMIKDMLYLKSMNSLAPPCDPVGLLAAQSVGEPSTQMTLNTFHFAGRGEMNVTLGIPRLKEILMTASKCISTPSMEIPFRTDVPKIQKKAEILKDKLTKITLADVLEYVEVTESLVLTPTRAQQYIMKMQFLPHECYKHEYCVNPKIILSHVESRFIDQLTFHINKLTKKSSQTISIENQVKKAANQTTETATSAAEDPTVLDVNGGEEEEEDHQSSDVDTDVDNEDAKTENRRKDFEDTRHNSENSDSDSEGTRDNPVFDSVREEEFEHLQTMRTDSTEPRQNLVVSKHAYVESYVYDVQKEEWCEIQLILPMRLRKINLSSLVQELAQASVVWQVSGLKRAFLVNNPKRGLTLKTDGLNIIEMFKYDHILDINKLYTNDIHAIADMYGIEAAGKVIVKEIQEVFKVYGITIDPRHLMLISDFMTFSGNYVPLNRTGLDSNPSALQKMSFETTTTFLRKAVWLGKTDTLESPSSSICVGRPCRSGTGAVSLRHQLIL